jgi:hypothetical protein
MADRYHRRERVKYGRKLYTVYQLKGRAMTLVNDDETEYVGVHMDDPKLRKVETK